MSTRNPLDKFIQDNPDVIVPVILVVTFVLAIAVHALLLWMTASPSLMVTHTTDV